MIHNLVFATIGQLATGILVFIAFVPPSKIGKGFGRFHTALALILWSVALWGSFSILFFVLAGSLLLAFFTSGKDAPYYAFLVISFIASIWLLVQPDAVRLGISTALMVHVPGVLVLGSSSVAMLLGHWYLVSPKLSISYLKILTAGLIASILLRSGILADVVIRSYDRLQQMHFFEIYGIFFLQRIALGLLLTLILSVLTYLCVKIRSTQSATGILYVVLVFCLIGELIGSYLFAKTGISF